MIAAIGALGGAAWDAFGDDVVGFFDGDDGGSRRRPTYIFSVDEVRRLIEPVRQDYERFVRSTFHSTTLQNRIISDPAVATQVANSPNDDWNAGDQALHAYLMNLRSGGGFPVTTTSSSRLGDAISTIGDNLGRVVTNTVEGAIGGAQAASGAAAQGSTISLTNPFVMLAIGAAIMILLRR